MTTWCMYNESTGDTAHVPPDKFNHYWQRGYRPIASRQTSNEDYQTTKKVRNDDRQQTTAHR